MDLNKVQIIGRVTQDPVVRQTQSGQNVTSFGVATNRRWRDKTQELREEVEFHNIVAWGKLAETCGNYLRKGSRLYVEGGLRTRSWQDSEGVQRKRTEIVLNNMIMLDRKEDMPTSMPSEASTPTPKTESKDQASDTDKGDSDDQEITMEDVPF